MDTLPSILDQKKKRHKVWRFIVYGLLVLNFGLALAVLCLDLDLSKLDNTKKLLGLAISIATCSLDLIVLVSIYFDLEFMILLFILCINILSFAIGVMFILIEISSEYQYYEGEIPLVPAHKKSWYIKYNAFYICSLTSCSYNIFTSLFVFKIRTNIRDIKKVLRKFSDERLSSVDFDKNDNLTDDLLNNKNTFYSENEQTQTSLLDINKKGQQHRKVDNYENEFFPKINEEFSLNNNDEIIPMVHKDNSSPSIQNSIQSSNRIKSPLSKVVSSLDENALKDNCEGLIREERKESEILDFQ